MTSSLRSTLGFARPILRGESSEELGREVRDGLGTWRCTCIELIVSQRVVVDARSLACEDCIPERTFVQMSHEGSRAAHPFAFPADEVDGVEYEDPSVTQLRSSVRTLCF